MHPQTTPHRFPAPRDATLRASQVDAVAVDEITFFFTSTDADAASVEARAIIESWLGTLEPADQQALALRYDPLPCPPSLEDEWQEGFALALSLASTQWRPAGYPRHTVERLASDQLEDAVRRHGPGVPPILSRWRTSSATVSPPSISPTVGSTRSGSPEEMQEPGSHARTVATARAAVTWPREPAGRRADDTPRRLVGQNVHHGRRAVHHGLRGSWCKRCPTSVGLVVHLNRQFVISRT